MDTIPPQPTKVGSFTIWVILALVAIVVIALALAFRGDDGNDEQVPGVGANPALSRSVSQLLRA